jgi:hypothetical protein
MVTKLYRVYTTIDDTVITWIALDRKEPPARYADAIDGLSADVDANEQESQAVDELFTHKEAEKWVDYLRKHYDDESAKIVEEPLPLERGVKGLAYPEGRSDLLKPDKVLKPVKEAEYPFSSTEVWGYYNLHQHGED